MAHGPDIWAAPRASHVDGPRGGPVLLLQSLSLHRNPATFASNFALTGWSLAAAALARLSKAQAKCAEELKALSGAHAASPAWASAGIAAVVRLCLDPAAAAAAATTLGRLTGIDDANDDLIREAGAIPPLVALLAGGIESKAATRRLVR